MAESQEPHSHAVEDVDHTWIERKGHCNISPPNYPTCNASILPKSYNSLSLGIHHCLIVNTPAADYALVVTLATDSLFQVGIVFQTLEVKLYDLTFFSSMASSRSMLSGWALMVWEKKQKVLLDRRASMGTWDQVQGV